MTKKESLITSHGGYTLLEEIVKYMHSVRDCGGRNRGRPWETKPLTRGEAIALTHLETAKLWLEKEGWSKHDGPPVE